MRTSEPLARRLIPRRSPTSVTIVSTLTDPGGLLFEHYLAGRGYESLAYEPDLGTRKRPDYLIQAGGHEVVVEVESLNT
jgi:hypothetical protein